MVGDITLENIKSVNLKEAKKQYDAEKANQEIIFAKQKFTEAQNQIDCLDRSIKELTAKKKEFELVLEKFK